MESHFLLSFCFSDMGDLKGGGCNTVLHKDFVIRLYALIFENASARFMVAQARRISRRNGDPRYISLY